MSFALYLLGLAVLIGGIALGSDHGRRGDDLCGDRMCDRCRHWNHDGGVAYPHQRPAGLMPSPTG